MAERFYHFFHNFGGTLHSNEVGVARCLCGYEGADDCHSLQGRREVETMNDLQRNTSTFLGSHCIACGIKDERRGGGRWEGGRWEGGRERGRERRESSEGGVGG